MSQLITAKIDCKKIDKARLFKGQKGIYLDLIIWVNDQPDQFGNNISIEQKTNKGEVRLFLGNGKTYIKQAQPAQQTQSAGMVPGNVEQSAPQDILPAQTQDITPVNELDDLPF